MSPCVWLDGGELDKVLASGESWEAEYRSRPALDREDAYRQKKKKKGFLGEVFDILD